MCFKFLLIFLKYLALACTRTTLHSSTRNKLVCVLPFLEINSRFLRLLLTSCWNKQTYWEKREKFLKLFRLNTNLFRSEWCNSLIWLYKWSAKIWVQVPPTSSIFLILTNPYLHSLIKPQDATLEFAPRVTLIYLSTDRCEKMHKKPVTAVSISMYYGWESWGSFVKTVYF